MKQYVIDELREEDYHRLKDYFDENYESSGLDGIYWIPLDETLLTSVQTDHAQCRPHCFALSLNPGRLSAELLVRTRNAIRCDCIQYATEVQRNWFIDVIDAIFEKLNVMS